MKLKTLLDVLTDTQMINICISGNDDFEIVGSLGNIPQKVLGQLWVSDVSGIFADDKATLVVVLKGDDGNDKSD